MTKKLFKAENKILIMLAFFSLSVGLWTNFKELWMQQNNLNVGEISSVLSVSTFISVLIMTCSVFSLRTIKTNSSIVKSKVSFKEIFSDRINNIYFLYGVFANIAMKSALGLKMLILTNKLNFSVQNATLYALIAGLLSDIVGIIVLKKFTSKNNFINIFIKFDIRNIMYLLAFLSNNVTIIIIAITWSILISTAYENITEAPYINRISNYN